MDINNNGVIENLIENTSAYYSGIKIND